MTLLRTAPNRFMFGAVSRSLADLRAPALVDPAAATRIVPSALEASANGSENIPMGLESTITT